MPRRQILRLFQIGRIESRADIADLQTVIDWEEFERPLTERLGSMSSEFSE